MHIIKRDGSKVPYDRQKIEIAIRKANYENEFTLKESEIQLITDRVEDRLKETELNNNLVAHTVEAIQGLVMSEINKVSPELAVAYFEYKSKRELARGVNTTDESILGLVDGLNEEVQKENSNKDPVLNSTQRDLIAGEISKDIVRRKILPRHLVKAHDDGITHIHDMDYLLQPLTNCELVNLEDMLQNGTVMNGNLIETPKSFQTACTIATQISAAVASSTFGGQTMTLSHLSPIIEVSRKKLRYELEGELRAIGAWKDISEWHFEGLVEHRLKQEIEDGVQTIQYQLETLSSTNGQSPFITIHMDLTEVPEGQQRDDLAMLIAEVIEQRILGVKNEKGVYVAPAFPKLTYVLDEGVNVNEEDPYFYLTELSAYCSTKRLVPDYISAKKMRELKEGNVYPPMGK